MSQRKVIPHTLVVVWLVLPVVVVALLWFLFLEPARHRSKAPTDATEAPSANN